MVENFRPGVTARLGLSPETALAENPRLIWASISGFGQEGPLRDRPAYDMVVQALSGVMSINGHVGAPAARLGIPAGDVVAGLYAVIGILSALHARGETGHGRIIDVSMLRGQLAMLSYQALYASVNDAAPGPQGAAHDSIATYRSFRAGDGREFVVTANTPRMWEELCRTLDVPELIGDDRFVDAAARLRNKEALWAILEARVATRPAAEWVELLTARLGAGRARAGRPRGAPGRPRRRRRLADHRAGRHRRVRERRHARSGSSARQRSKRRTRPRSAATRSRCSPRSSATPRPTCRPCSTTACWARRESAPRSADANVENAKRAGCQHPALFVLCVRRAQARETGSFAPARLRVRTREDRRELGEGASGGVIGVVGDDRATGVAARPQRRAERDGADRRHVVAERWRAGRRRRAPPPEPNGSKLAAVGQGGRRHRLDDPDDALAELAGQQAGADGDIGRRGLRGGHDEHFGVGQQVADRDGGVTGAGRHVDQEHVEVAEEDVGEELLDRAMQHRAAPGDDLVLGARAQEHADRDRLDPEARRAAGRDRRRASAAVRGHRRPASPSSPGIEKPCTSASMRPTRSPRAARATARFAVTVDLPTPPLPLVTAMTRVSESAVNGFVAARFPPRRRSVSAPRCSSVITPTSTCTFRMPGTPAAASATSRSMRLAIGQPAIVEQNADGGEAVLDQHLADHLELAERTAQLGVGDRADRIADGVDHAVRIQAWAGTPAAVATRSMSS